jgi:tRNA (guanine-N7-)-methyltransferase
MEPDMTQHKVSYTFSEINKPQDFGTLFPKNQPIALDIGAGKGEFLETTAQKFPNLNYISIERKYPRTQLIQKRIEKNNLDNAIVLQGHIEHIIPHAMFRESVQIAYMNFPDPWKKDRYAKRRNMNSEFVEQIHELLVPNGEFHFATDVPDYIEHTYNHLNAHPGFENILNVKWLVNDVEEHYKTLFYHHARKIGENCHFVRFRKIA